MIRTRRVRKPERAPGGQPAPSEACGRETGKPRGLIGIRDDYSLIVSHNKVPEQMRHLFGARERQINLPEESRDYPDPYYLARHREVFCL